MFVGRKQELKFLNDEYLKVGFSFIPIYGRRRIGKTELIKRFIKNKSNVIFFNAIQGSKKENIQLFKQSSKYVINLSDIKDAWIPLFKNISTLDNTIIIIDEFPYLVNSDSSIPSKFQYIIDNYLSDKNIMLILTGSLQSIMWNSVLSYNAPLYGRRTGQIHLKSLHFEDVLSYFTNKSIKNVINIYGITGGIPAYFRFFNDNKDFFNILFDAILPQNKYLREEPIFLMRQEFRDPKIYLSILSAIGEGKVHLSEIINYVGLKDKTSLSPYLHNLILLNYVEKEYSLLRNKYNKKGIYKIKDRLFLFWSRIIRPYEGILDIKLDDLKKEITNRYKAHMGYIFESLIRDIFLRKNSYNISKIGRWWYKDKEIDLLGINEKTKQIIFGEAKWKDKVDAKKIAKELNEKTQYVDWHNKERRETLYIFAKSFKRKVQQIENKPVKCINLKDLEKWIKTKPIV